MITRLRNYYRNSTLADKIRLFYIAILIPMFLLLMICVINLVASNNRYKDMIASAGVASEFSLDFKRDFDYETYLVIVENKTIEESQLDELLEDAKRIVGELDSLTDPGENKDRLTSASKYIENLEKYKDHIELNLITGNRYEENMVIWENDVQIVTELIRETLNQYIYYEIRDMQQAREQMEKVNVNIIRSLMVAAIIISIATFAFSYMVPTSITRPIRQVADVTRKVAEGDFSVRTNIEYGDEVKELGDSLNIMIDKIEELLDQVRLEQIRLRNAELELLQAQINPHFLYNTLDTIVWLAEAGEQSKVVSMVGSLSKFFRTSLNQGKENISIGEELQHARSYLEIQQVRYQDILDYEIDVPESVFNYLIPKITIQPLVENALYHGIKNKRGKGKIRITGELMDNYLCLYVEDDGIGMSPERLEQINDRIEHLTPNSGEIFGLYNVNERIRLRMGDDFGISIKSEYMLGSKVTVKLPLVVEENKPS